ncbi:MAG: dicarboxylate/amino acid:cation symporter [Bacteroidaceae bacterium]|nr:dicarboxylate/amino acid:cation symporter [Bacteroidaceae bacterium]
MKIFSKISITGQIILALLLACVVGYFLQDTPNIADLYIKPFGTIFLNLLKFIVVPLVMCSIISGIVSMKDISKVGRIGFWSMLYFMLTTIFAATLGLVVATLLKDFFPTINLNVENTQTDIVTLSLMDQLVGFFPKNILEPILGSSMMQVIVIALFIGIAIVHVGEKAEAAKQVILSFNEIVTKILGYIMAIAPIGVFCMLVPVVATNGAQVLGSYAVLIGVDYLCFFLHAILIYATCVFLLGRINPLRFFKEMTPAMLFAYSSDSSVATLPYTMECTRRLGVKKDLGNFVLSLGATVNMDGVAIYLGVTSVFIATCCGMDLNFNQYLAIAISSTIVSIGTPAIPGGSLALMAMVFASAGIPVEGVAIAAGIDRLVDMARTTMSVTGDASCAVILQRFLNKKKSDDTE